MDNEEPGWPVIDDFFERLATGRRADTCRRYQRVRLRLYDFLDVDDMTQWLLPAQATLLAAEREFQREGAVWTLFGIEGLLRCAPGFVTSEHLPHTVAEARMQISVTSRLMKHLWRHRLDATLAGPYREAMVAVGRARSDLDDRLDGEAATAGDVVI